MASGGQFSRSLIHYATRMHVRLYPLLMLKLYVAQPATSISQRRKPSPVHVIHYSLSNYVCECCSSKRDVTVSSQHPATAACSPNCPRICSQEKANTQVASPKRDTAARMLFKDRIRSSETRRVWCIAWNTEQKGRTSPSAPPCHANES